MVKIFISLFLMAVSSVCYASDSQLYPLESCFAYRFNRPDLCEQSKENVVQDNAIESSVKYILERSFEENFDEEEERSQILYGKKKKSRKMRKRADVKKKDKRCYKAFELDEAKRIFLPLINNDKRISRINNFNISNQKKGVSKEVICNYFERYKVQLKNYDICSHDGCAYIISKSDRMHQRSCLHKKD